MLNNFLMLSERRQLWIYRTYLTYFTFDRHPAATNFTSSSTLKFGLEVAGTWVWQWVASTSFLLYLTWSDLLTPPSPTYSHWERKFTLPLARRSARAVSKWDRIWDLEARSAPPKPSGLECTPARDQSCCVEQLAKEPHPHCFRSNGQVVRFSFFFLTLKPSLKVTHSLRVGSKNELNISSWNLFYEKWDILTSS